MQTTPNLSGAFSAGFVPIRAPLTVDDDDDDDDYGPLTEERNSGSSYSGGVGSGTDDGYGYVSGDEDDETELEDVVMGGIGVHRLLEEEVVGEGSDSLGSSVIYRPFAGDVEEETSVNYSSLEEESEKSDEFEGVSESEADRFSVNAKVVIPRASLSLDDDEFDEIDYGEAALLRVAEAPSEEESEGGDKTLQSGDVGMVDEPGCSDSVIGVFVPTEEEVVRMSYLDKLNNSLDEHSPGVPPGGSSSQLIERGVVQSAITREDGDGSIHVFNGLMKPGDVEGVQDDAGEFGEMGMTDKPECSGSVSSEEDMVQVKFPEENSLVVVPGDSGEFLVEAEGETGNVDRGLDKIFSQLVDEVGQESISKESNNRTDDDSICEGDELLIPGEESIGLGSKESGVEDTGTMIGEAKGYCENNCSAISELEKPECKGEPVTSMSCERFKLTPNLNYVMTRNPEAAGGIVVESGCCSSGRKSEQEAENVGKQESKDIDGKFSLLDEDRASSLKSSFVTANEILENGKQVSEQINKPVNIQVDSEPDQISVGLEETSLISDKDVERTVPENLSVNSYDISENETPMGLLLHNHTFMELDEYEEKGDTREKLSESTFQKCSEELPSDHFVQLISGKVKERIQKTELLKAKIQSIIGKLDLCGENSAVTEVESKPSQSRGEHQTSLENEHVSEQTTILLPELEIPADRDFSINILVIGKTGVGKSATINSMFGETKSPVGAFGATTKSANYVVGNVGGILVRILDTPGLMSSATEERFNQEVLMSIKKRMKMFPVDVILYIDRLDENPDIHLLRIVTSSLGSSMWRNSIVVLTHAASIPPDSSNYNDFIDQRFSLMYQSIRQAIPELSRLDRSKMPQIILAENNIASESTCPGWRMNLLGLCCSVKTQSKADEQKARIVGSQLRSITLLCSLWNALLPGNTCYSNDDMKEKKRHLLDSYPEILKDEDSRERLEQETLQVKNQEPEYEEITHENENRTVVGRVRRRRRGSLGFQATKRFGIFVDTGDFHTGFSIGSIGCRREEQDEEGRKMVVKMRGLMCVLGLVPMLMISQ